ncbi:DUF3149 domain-containing protein [Thalassotalea sp. PLHSN55]
MNLLELFLNDPVVLISFTGLAIVLGICAFYVWYFLRNIDQNK